MYLAASQTAESRNPSSTDCMISGPSDEKRSVKARLSMVITCEMFATDCLGRRDQLFGSRTLPGAPAKRRLELIIATMLVLILLALNASVARSTPAVVWRDRTGGRGQDRSTRSRRVASPILHRNSDRLGSRDALVEF